MLCVIARVDPGARERLAALRKTAEAWDSRRGELYGHITLVTYVEDEEERFIAFCRALLSGRRAFSVRYGGIEILPATSILVASLEKEGELLSLHGEIAEKWSGGLDRWTGDERWKPHTTLLYNSDGDLTAAATAADGFVVALLSRYAFIDYSRQAPLGRYLRI